MSGRDVLDYLAVIARDLRAEKAQLEEERTSHPKRKEGVTADEESAWEHLLAVLLPSYAPTVLDAAAALREPRIGGKIVAGERAAEVAPLNIVSDGDHDRAVGRREHLVRHQRRMAVAVTLWDGAGEEEAERLGGAEGDQGIEQREVDVLPFPAFATVM